MHEHSNDPAYVGAPDTAPGIALMPDEAAAPIEPFRLDLVQMETAMVLAMIANEYFARTPVAPSTATGSTVETLGPEPVILGLAGRMSIRTLKVRPRQHIESHATDEAQPSSIQETPGPVAEEWTVDNAPDSSASDYAATEQSLPEPAASSMTTDRPPRVTNVIAFPLAAKYMQR